MGRPLTKPRARRVLPAWAHFESGFCWARSRSADAGTMRGREATAEPGRVRAAEAPAQPAAPADKAMAEQAARERRPARVDRARAGAAVPRATSGSRARATKIARPTACSSFRAATARFAIATRTTRKRIRNARTGRFAGAAVASVPLRASTSARRSKTVATDTFAAAPMAWADSWYVRRRISSAAERSQTRASLATAGDRSRAPLHPRAAFRRRRGAFRRASRPSRRAPVALPSWSAFPSGSRRR